MDDIRNIIEDILRPWSVPKHRIDRIMLLVEQSMFDLAAEEVSKTISDLRDQAKPEP